LRIISSGSSSEEAQKRQAVKTRSFCEQKELIIGSREFAAPGCETNKNFARFFKKALLNYLII
jgi:hypothetical protein